MLEKRNLEIIGDNFPPTLVTNAAETSLDVNQTPDCSGIDANTEGFLRTGSIISGTSRVAREYTIGADTFQLHYDRLSRVSGTQWIWNAPKYKTVLLPQGLGNYDFLDDGNSILVMLPIGTGGLIFFKTTGAYICSNASSSSARWDFTGLIQEAGIAAATHAVELDGVVYMIKTEGLFAITANAEVKELTDMYRAEITPAALTCDYVNKQIVIGSTHVYDVGKQRIFDYSSSFVYQSRAIQAALSAPFSCDEIGFDIYRDSDGVKEIKFQTKVEDREWSWDYTVVCPSQRGFHEHVFQPLSDVDQGRTFQIKITALDDDIWIKRIYGRMSNYSVESRDN